MLFQGAYGFTYTPRNNTDSTSIGYMDKYSQIKDIQDSDLPFSQYIHQISIGAGDPRNTTAITDYKAIQKHMRVIENLISTCDVNKSDYIISSDSATNGCIKQSSFAYETCAGDPNIYSSICKNAVIENILKTTEPSAEELNTNAYEEAEIYVALEYR